MLETTDISGTRKASNFTQADNMRYYKAILAAALVLTVTGCSGGGGGSSDGSTEVIKVPDSPQTGYKLPSLAHVQSDYSGHPDYGTAADPLVLTGCTINPPIWWQASLCAAPPNGMTWPQGNHYSTAVPGSTYWTLSATNEDAFDSSCNNGMANKNREINKDLFFVTPGEGKITLRTEFAPTANCGKTPYLAISNIESGTLTGYYGDRIHAKFTIDANFSVDPTHIHLYHFFIMLADPAGNRKMSWLHLGCPDQYQPLKINWNWPVMYSYYYPGAEITFWPIHKYNSEFGKTLPCITAKGRYEYDIDFDDVIKNLNPEMAVTTTRILGVEFAIEQNFAWPASGPPPPPIFQEMTLSNLTAYQQAIEDND